MYTPGRSLDSPMSWYTWWSSWVLWSAVAWAAGAIIGWLIGWGALALAQLLSIMGGPASLLGWLLGTNNQFLSMAGMGAAIGFVQWLALRDIVPSVTRGTWVRRTALGWMLAEMMATWLLPIAFIIVIGVYMGMLGMERLPHPTNLGWYGTEALVGVVQWRVLRQA